MSLSTDEYKNRLIRTFRDMNSTEDDQKFANALAFGAEELVKSGEVSGSVSGEDLNPTGEFSSTSVSGYMNVDGNIAYNKIIEVCDNMYGGRNGNAYLARGIADAIDLMCTQGTFGNVLIEGTTTLGDVTTYSADQADGEFTSDGGNAIYSDLVSLFSAMERSSNRKGDADFAQVLAQSVTDYIINGTIALRGATHLRNASGTGSIE